LREDGKSLSEHRHEFIKRSFNINNYPHATWRLLISPLLDGATNMAIDEAILYALSGGNTLPTIRFYQWQPACLSLGYNQKWTDVNEATCQQHGYNWTRRATGGKAIFHTDELTYSLIVHKDDPRVIGGILKSYKTLSRGLLQGLRILGVDDAEQVDKRNQPRTQADRQGPVCFDTPARYEITWQGKKLIGSAQLRRKNIVLQHGTLPLYGNLNRILDLLYLSDEERTRQKQILPQRATTLEQILGQIPTFDEVATGLATGLAETLNLSLKKTSLNKIEQTIASQLRADQYANDSWNKRV
jgi:lipoate-protein ligase A